MKRLAPAESGLVNVKAYGAAGDGTTNDNTAIQNAINALPSGGGTLYFPAGTFYMNTAALTGLPSNTKVLGAGRDGTTLRVNSGTHNMWDIPASRSRITFESMTFSMNGSGGHIFAPAGSLQTTNFIDIRCVQNNPAKSIFVMADAGYFDNLWFGCILTHLGATSVPAFDFTAAASSRYNSNSWQRCQLNNDSASNTWFFDFATSSAVDYLYDNAFRDITGEINNGGLFRLKACNGFIFDNVNFYDQTTTTKDLIWVGAGSGGVKSRNCVFRRVGRRGGTLGSGLVDIFLETSNATDMKFEHCNTATMSGYTVDLNSNSNAVALGCRNVTFSDAAGSFVNLDSNRRRLVALTDGATVTVDVETTDIGTVTLGGNRTFAFSGTPYDGQKLELRIRQDGTGSRVPAWPASVRWSGGTAPTLTTTANKTDYIGFEYNAADSKWDGLAERLNL